MPKRRKEENSQLDSTSVMVAVASVVDFMKQQVKTSLMNAKNSGKIEVDNEELRKICSYVDASMSTSFVNASGQIQQSIENLK